MMRRMVMKGMIGKVSDAVRLTLPVTAAACSLNRSRRRNRVHIWSTLYGYAFFDASQKSMHP